MKISQRRACTLRKRVNELEQKIRDMKRGWGQEWPDGKHLFSLAKGDENGVEDAAVVRAARLLGHPVIVTESQGTLHFYGVEV